MDLEFTKVLQQPELSLGRLLQSLGEGPYCVNSTLLPEESPKGITKYVGCQLYPA